MQQVFDHIYVRRYKLPSYPISELQKTHLTYFVLNYLDVNLDGHLRSIHLSRGDE